MDVKNLRIVVLCLILFSAVLLAQAQDAAPPAAKDGAVKSAGQQPAMSPEQKAKMALMQEYMTLNEHHKFFESLTGTWNAKVELWMDPKAEPKVSLGTSEGKIIMGGRFLEQTFNSTDMGKPYEGRGIMGYDNMKEQYTTIWFDNMATGVTTGSGQYNPESRMLMTEGSMSCPITQQSKRWYRDVLTFSDDDNYTYETYMRDQRGVEYKSMAIKYSRVK